MATKRTPVTEDHEQTETLKTDVIEPGHETRGAATPAYALAVEEAFMVLDGVLDVETFDAAGNATVARLGARDLALIAPGTKHRLVNRDAATVRFGAIAGSKDAVPIAWREAVAAR